MITNSSLWIWIPLMLAVLPALFKQRNATLTLLAVALGGAWMVDKLTTLALAISVAGLGLGYAIPKLSGYVKNLAWTLLLLWCAALMLHALPGFGNTKVLDTVLTGPMSTPFSLYLNIDKPLVFFALWLAFPSLLGTQAAPHWRNTLFVLPPLLGLLLVAWFLGALKPEFSLPDWLWLFALNNLLLTCMAEEALFRGLIQQTLTRVGGAIFGIAAASVLFGLAHLSGGILLVVFAALAGLGYGLAFHFSGRLWVAVASHFLFNLTHLVFFTYPVLAR
ncbi:CPBP family intramembrane glutamic endopeptidase [Vibrio fluvialis]|uniref:CPBP family intramembrane glutamic endopeptidase n=1 Tax=Vibrio fluvialis TaxID=676 RepID=UPI001404D1F5|nr:CPBP family intramembrane glutamic endopeptidase [Vibrio fluvialis]NHN73910.1 CPBP family intramembrane metalloprotease [Vibrio fluvialis]